LNLKVIHEQDMNTIEKLNEIFMDVLDLEELNLKRETTANDIEEWDSLSHILLIVNIEKQFKIRFTSREIQSWKNVGEMVDCIEVKVS
jgi:acyl carrier protein